MKSIILTLFTTVFALSLGIPMATNAGPTLISHIEAQNENETSLGPEVMKNMSNVTAEETSPTPEKVVRQGIATSSPDPLPGHEEHQSVTVLRLRDDNAVYSGRVTFTTTQPVEVQILHRNMTTTTPEGGPTIPERFGQLNILQLPGGNGQVTITNVEPRFTEGATSFAASVPFSGNAVALHNLEGNEFVATYTATADILGPATRADDIAKELK